MQELNREQMQELEGGSALLWLLTAASGIGIQVYYWINNQRFCLPRVVRLKN